MCAVRNVLAELSHKGNQSSTRAAGSQHTCLGQIEMHYVLLLCRNMPPRSGELQDRYPQEHLVFVDRAVFSAAGTRPVVFSAAFLRENLYT